MGGRGAAGIVIALQRRVSTRRQRARRPHDLEIDGQPGPANLVEHVLEFAE